LMLTAQGIDEKHGAGKLPGPYQKACAIDLPLRRSSPHAIHPWGEGG
jgi:hypothetical protein